MSATDNTRIIYTSDHGDNLGKRGLWGKSKLDRRKGARENQAKTDAANARETIKAHEERTDVEADVARGGNARDRLHADWKR